MGLFGSRKNSRRSQRNSYKVKITAEDEKRFKMRSENIHDPILNAVNEAQPFEQANFHTRNPSSLSEGRLNDVFGNPIANPDISNPARARDERPLDTIRAFEYAITGDITYKQQLETPQLGWSVRDDFPMFSSNPYAVNGGAQPQQYDEYGNPVFNGRGSTMTAEQGVYTPAPRKQQQKKKKRGLFRRK